MTPKEKAKELVDKLEWLCDHPTNMLEKSVAKQCALICVDEIIEENKRSGNIDTYAGFQIYWQGVKQEIKTL